MINPKGPNWHEHSTRNGFRWLGFQPTSTEVYANPDAVVLQFADDDAGAGVQIALAHQSFRDYMLTLATARENIEAKQDAEE
jgi:hypothetical protein